MSPQSKHSQGHRNTYSYKVRGKFLLNSLSHITWTCKHTMD